MPVIIATRPQQRGVQRSYVIAEFKELGSEERHQFLKAWLRFRRRRKVKAMAQIKNIP